MKNRVLGNKKIGWTRTELQKFAKYDAMDYEFFTTADSYMDMGGVIVGSEAEQLLKELGNELCILEAELKALMGTTRFEILSNDRCTREAWREEVSARFAAKHPWVISEDCRLEGEY